MREEEKGGDEVNTQIIITPAGVLWVAGAIVSISAAAGVPVSYTHLTLPTICSV